MSVGYRDERDNESPSGKGPEPILPRVFPEVGACNGCGGEIRQTSGTEAPTHVRPLCMLAAWMPTHEPQPG